MGGSADERTESTDKGIVGTFTDEVDWPVFLFGAGITALFVILFALDPDAAANTLFGIQENVLAVMNWAILIIVFSIVVFLAFLIVGPWGKLKIGDEDPEYSFLSFFAMLYSAGFAAGVVFWGPAEALFHYADVPPLYPGVEAETMEAAVIAQQYAFFHWGVPQLATFTVMGIAIGYFAYNYENVPLRVSSILTPIVGADRLDGPLARVIDIVAVFATLGGVATSLGFIGSQFVFGMDFQWGIDLGNAGIILVVTGMTVLFTISMVLGVNRGIRRISNFNMTLMLILMVATLIVGPTAWLLNVGVQGIGGFLGDFVQMSLFTDAANGAEWSNAWSVFYWTWALAWSPFAGLFIARISRGRTVREVAATGIVATSAATIPWFLIIGGTALHAQHTGQADILGPLFEFGAEVPGFLLFQSFPLANVFLIAFLTLVTTFFVTSADSSTLAVSMMTTGGKESPSTVNRVFWGVMLGLTASILMIIGGADALQAAAVTTGGPWSLVAFLAMLGLIKAFIKDSGPVLLQKSTRWRGGKIDYGQDEAEPDAVPTDDD